MAARPPLPALTREDTLQALSRSVLFQGLPLADLERVLDHADLVDIPPGVPLVERGQPCDSLWLVLSGELRLSGGRNGAKTLGPGESLGAPGFFAGWPYAHAVSAERPSFVARWSSARWDELAARDPGLALAVLRRSMRNLQGEGAERRVLLRERSSPRPPEVDVQMAGEVHRVATGTRLGDLFPAEIDGHLVVGGLLGQKPVSLSTPLFANAAVAPLTAEESDGRHIYVRSVGLLLLAAARRVARDLAVRIGPSLGNLQIVEIPGVTPEGCEAVALRIAAEMERLADENIALRHEVWAVEEALAHFQESGWDDAARLLRTHRHAAISLASCGDVYALGMGPLLPSAERIRGYRLSPHPDGLALDYGRYDPRSAAPTPVAPPNVDPHEDMTREHREWLRALGVNSVGAFNDLCISGQVAQLIRVAEGFHEKRISRLADRIAARRDDIRVISIAGPSSSGKTTLIKRLSVQLQINGLNPVGLSLDDYYLDRERTARNGRGEYDFEALEALDLSLLQDHVGRLLAGETVKTARYDFRSGLSHADGGPTISLHPGDLLILEGIHGLNPRLLGPILDRARWFRVFLHPATTLPFDRLTWVSATDLRLIRRIVRDRHQRGYTAAQNILRWSDVQAGERQHIFPFQGEADAVFDSSLVYEPAVLKVYAERYLLEVPSDHPAYAAAYRLRHLVDRFVAIYPDHVPPTSILREFIGGSGFEY
jgi:uridine kinase